MLMQGKVREAFESVVPNLAGKSDQEDHLVLVGDILMALGNLADAEAEFLKALEQNPASPGALIGRAAIAASQGDFDRARQYLDAATEGNPESDFAWRANGTHIASLMTQSLPTTGPCCWRPPRRRSLTASLRA
jgi:tetratricopeptide (TPR) repeat protein